MAIKTKTKKKLTAWYKTLVQHVLGDSEVRAMPHNGGTLAQGYALPHWSVDKWMPGAWMPVVPRAVECKQGYHVTQKPGLWRSTSTYGRESELVFVVEPHSTEDRRTEHATNVHKRAFNTVRLLRPVTPQEYLRLVLRPAEQTVLEPLSFTVAMRTWWCQQYGVAPLQQLLERLCGEWNDGAAERAKKSEAAAILASKRQQERDRKQREKERERDVQFTARNRFTVLSNEVRRIQKLTKKLKEHGVTVTVTGTLTLTYKHVVLNQKV